MNQEQQPAGTSNLDRHLPEQSRKRLKRALMWAAAALILAWIFRRLDPAELLIAFKQTRPLFFALAAVGFAAVTLAFDSITHHWVFNRFNPPANFKTVFRVRGESYLLLSLGFLYGQGGMAYMYSRRTDQPLSEVSGSIMFLMLNTLITLMIFPTIAMIFFIRDVASPEFQAAPEGRFILKWLLITWPLILAHFVFWGRDWQFGFRQRVKEGAGRTFDQARIKDYLAVLGLRGVQTGLWVIFSWLALLAMGVDLQIRDLLILGPIVGLASAIPTPGRLGTSQAAWVLLFSHLADPEALFAFSLLWTMASNLLRWAMGAIFMALPGK